jgi:hypothetical protein
MTHSHLINHNSALPLLLAGKCTFTVKNSQNGNRFTFKINRPKTGDIKNKNDRRNALRFISVMTGPDNETNYKYFGTIKILNDIDFDGNQDFEYTFSQKAKISKESQSVKVFEWFMHWLRRGKLPEFIEIWNSGNCCKCGRKLTDPLSIELSIGPECRKMMK